MAGKVMIGEDTGRDDEPRSRCSLIGSGIGFIHIINSIYNKYDPIRVSLRWLVKKTVSY